MKLYFAKGTAALPVHVALEEAGATYEAVEVNFKQGEQQSAAFLGRNPKGRVPVLETDRGLLTEVPAILAYIGQMYPNAGLIPSDPFDFAQAQAFNAFLCATVHVNHAHKLRGSRWSDDEASHVAMRSKVPENMTANAEMIENTFFKGPWVMGDTYSICDPYLFVITRWMPGDGVDLKLFPKISDHYARMQERPAVQRVLAIHGA
jgi:glutathione S-transferase